MANKYSIKMEILGVCMCVSTYIFIVIGMGIYWISNLAYSYFTNIIHVCYNHMKIVIVIVVICNSWWNGETMPADEKSLTYYITCMFLKR